MGKRILVVGGAGGIGSALVRALLATGAEVRVTVRDDMEHKQVEQYLPGVSDILRLDLGNADAVLATLRPYVSALAEPLDAVAVCAAIGPIGPSETAPLQQFREVFEVNVISQLAIVQATADSLRQSHGRLMLLSSILGRIAMPFFGAYSAAKFALEALGDILRRELSAHGVDVILAAPGGVRTPMTINQYQWSVERLEALDDTERGLYGPLYQGHQRMAMAGEGGSSTPQAIALTLVEALLAEKPQSRYLIGPDAHQFWDAYQPMDDAGRDLFVKQLFGMN